MGIAFVVIRVSLLIGVVLVSYNYYEAIAHGKFAAKDLFKPTQIFLIVVLVFFWWIIVIGAAIFLLITQNGKMKKVR